MPAPFARRCGRDGRIRCRGDDRNRFWLLGLELGGRLRRDCRHPFAAGSPPPPRAAASRSARSIPVSGRCGTSTAATAGGASAAGGSIASAAVSTGSAASRAWASSCCRARAARDRASSRSSSRAGAIARRPRSVGTRIAVAVGARRTMWIGSSPRSTARPRLQPNAPLRTRNRDAFAPRSRTRVTGPGLSTYNRLPPTQLTWTADSPTSSRTLSSVTISARPIAPSSPPSAMIAKLAGEGVTPSTPAAIPAPARMKRTSGTASSRGRNGRA